MRRTTIVLKLLKTASITKVVITVLARQDGNQTKMPNGTAQVDVQNISFLWIKFA